MATHSSILDEEIPQTEERGGLLSTGLQRVRHNHHHDWTTKEFPGGPLFRDEGTGEKERK